MDDTKKDNFLVVNDLSKWYLQRKNSKGIFSKHGKQWVKAVDGVSFSLREGEILGIIGESGCGKSTLGRLLVKLEENTGGDITLNGLSTNEAVKKDPVKFRRMAQIVFQNPFDTFSPRHTIGQIMIRALKLHNIGSSEQDRYEICKKTLEDGGLMPAADYLSRFPHELSGGQLQRISILRSMLLNPMFIVADEPVSMLDVSVRADIINMLLELTERRSASMVFISHDLATTRYISDRVAVMYLGRIVEMGETDEVLHNPLHPYTKVLISNCASIDPTEKKQPISVEGEPPTPVNPGPGCYFAPRCFMAKGECFERYPAISKIEGTDHMVFCHYISKGSQK